MDKSPTKNIVILGGSYGGMSVAHYVLRHVIPQLPESHTYRVVLVSIGTEVMCRPACPRAMISDKFFSQEKLFVNIPKQFAQYPKENFRFIQGAATHLRHTDRNLDFHALVIATGASAPSPLIGSNGDQELLKSNWSKLRRTLPTVKHVVIAGGGPTGVETAGELGEYLNGRAWFFQDGLKSPTVKITLLTSGSKLLPVLRPSIAAKAEKLLAQVGVTVVKNAPVQDVTSSSNDISEKEGPVTVNLKDGRTLEADLYIPAFGTTPNTAFIDKSLLADDGRVNTNTATLRVDQAGPRIYAIGDASTFARAAVHHILGAIPVLGANIKRDLLSAAGQSVVGADREFKEEKREMQMVPIGRSKGVGAAFGWQLPSFMVWLIKGRDYFLWTTPALWSGTHWAKES
ncbi:FAD/NAD(P)-binding domain-containing protein [Truncatella angustata]|uniref:FAD/NAD(P)-binding domain-containing protein n=1 Tax=Truncatella angustata TaxID=152316 RepID=A0A9P8UCZ3_9PEZI|nr:FAD/NAD(P)-binding domain-containing protein [Truncatella angustata]KAH6647378.1 FAD/NAD(P)-binding domain-containing protein [Truncatella angustata]